MNANFCVNTEVIFCINAGEVELSKRQFWTGDDRWITSCTWEQRKV